MAEATLEDAYFFDSWRRSDGVEVLLPSDGREHYGRQIGWVLIAPQAYDRRVQQQADIEESRYRGIGTTHGMPGDFFPAT